MGLYPTVNTFSRIVFCVFAVIAMIAGVSGRCRADSPEPTPYEVGLARVDVTPQTPIRLSGFASRLTESVGVREPIFARAMAIRPAGGGEPVVLITVDSLCIPAYMRDEIASRLKAKKNIAARPTGDLLDPQPHGADGGQRTDDALRAADPARAHRSKSINTQKS